MALVGRRTNHIHKQAGQTKASASLWNFLHPSWLSSNTLQQCSRPGYVASLSNARVGFHTIPLV